MTNASIRQNLSAILPGNWNVMHFICFKKFLKTYPDECTATLYLVHMPIGFQALCVYTTGELLSETIVATWAMRSKMVATPFSLHSNLLSVKNSHAHSGMCSPSSCTIRAGELDWCAFAQGNRQNPLVKNWAVSPPCVHQHPAECGPRL